jgi:hypothetical protein
VYIIFAQKIAKKISQKNQKKNQKNLIFFSFKTIMSRAGKFAKYFENSEKKILKKYPNKKRSEF